MRKTLFFIPILIGIMMFNGCTDSSMNITDNERSKPQLRAHHDDYFDWDRITEIKLRNGDAIPLPWSGGSSCLGIPTDWIDTSPNGTSYDKRPYARENGWHLVYSNIKKTDAGKYFSLYNEYTGILRFFFYYHDSGAGTGTTNSHWGIQIDKESSLLNFTQLFATAIDDRKAYPAYVSSPNGTFSGNVFKTAGYKANNWYGLEIECAYDPNVNMTSNFNFEVRSWASNTIKLSGTGITTGNISGTLTSTSSKGLSVNLSDMFNVNNSTTVKQDNNMTINNLGAKIDNEISLEKNKSDKFFTKLWDKISKGASSGIESGAKKGLESILSGGGSLATDALSSLASSLIGGNKTSVYHADLSVTLNTKFDLEGVTMLDGWGGITALPIPATKSAQDVMYSKPLGIWNIESTPIIVQELTVTSTYRGTKQKPGSFVKSDYQYAFSIPADYETNKVPKIILNPELQKQFQIKNYKRILCLNTSRSEGVVIRTNYEPIAFLDGNKYVSGSNYYGVFNTSLKQTTSKDIYDTPFYSGFTPFIVKISFDLVENSTNKTQKITKYFISKIETKIYETIRYEGGDSGGGKFPPILQ